MKARRMEVDYAINMQPKIEIKENYIGQQNTRPITYQ